MQEMFSKLSSYAALLGVIGAIGGGFMAWGEFNNRIAQLENKEFIVNETVDLSGIIKELEEIKADVKINDAAIKFIDAKIEELKAEFDNPLLQEKHMPNVDGKKYPYTKKGKAAAAKAKKKKEKKLTSAQKTLPKFLQEKIKKSKRKTAGYGGSMKKGSKA